MAGSVSRPSIQRQFQGPKRSASANANSDCPSFSTRKFVKNATEMPSTIFNWLNDTILPRMAGGEISAIYIGAMMSEAPTPNPPIMRATTRNKKEGARAEATADTAYSTAARKSTRRRPKASLSGPATIMASVAVSVNELTAHPISSLVKVNCLSMKPTTPDMTEASKPMRKPPRATIRAVRVI